MAFRRVCAALLGDHWVHTQTKYEHLYYGIIRNHIQGIAILRSCVACAVLQNPDVLCYVHSASIFQWNRACPVFFTRNGLFSLWVVLQMPKMTAPTGC